MNDAEYTAAQIEDDFVGEKITHVEYEDGDEFALIILNGGHGLEVRVKPTYREAPEEDGHSDD